MVLRSIRKILGWDNRQHDEKDDHHDKELTAATQASQ